MAIFSYVGVVIFLSNFIIPSLGNLVSPVNYEVWLKNNGTVRPADMVEDPQTSETHDINPRLTGVSAERH